MAKNTQNTAAPTDNTPAPLAQDDAPYSLTPFTPNRDMQPIALLDVMREMGISGPRIPAEQLVDQTFVILAAKPFASAYKEGTHAYFCVCSDAGTGELFTSVLGGQAVVDIIDALASTNFQAPLRVTLRKIAQGKYAAKGGYYSLE